MGAAVLHAYTGERKFAPLKTKAGHRKNTREKSKLEKTKNQLGGGPLQETSGPPAEG
jgi:hypothetical protein